MPKKPTAKFQPLTTAQFVVLHVLNETRKSLTQAQIERALESRHPDMGLKALRRLVLRALQRLRREGVAVHVKDDAGGYWYLPQNLPVVARASLLLSKPPKEGVYHARKIPRQPQHEQRGAIAGAEQTQGANGAAASDTGAIRGQGTIPDAGGAGTGGETVTPVDGGGAISPAPTEKSAAETLLAPPGRGGTADPDSEHPHIETVAIKAPSGGGHE